MSKNEMAITMRGWVRWLRVEDLCRFGMFIGVAFIFVGGLLNAVLFLTNPFSPHLVLTEAIIGIGLVLFSLDGIVFLAWKLRLRVVELEDWFYDHFMLKKTGKRR